MTVATLPGGLWYPERSYVGNPGPTVTVTVAPGDAAGAQFSFGGACRVIGAGVQMAFGPTADFDVALTTLAGAVLRSTSWPGPRNPHASPASQLWVVTLVWEPVDLAADTPYRLLCAPTGATGVSLRDAPAAGAPLAPGSTTLGYKVTRVGGIWTEHVTRQIMMALQIGGF